MFQRKVIKDESSVLPQARSGLESASLSKAIPPHPRFSLNLGGPWWWNLNPATPTREPFPYKVRAHLNAEHLPLLEGCELRAKMGPSRDSNFEFVLYLYPDTEEQLTRARAIGESFPNSCVLTRGHFSGREWIPGRPVDRSEHQ